MSNQRPRRAGPAATPLVAVRTLVLAAASAACLVASAVHAGLTIAIGPLVVAEPPLPAASIVEGAIGACLAIAVAVAIARSDRTRDVTLATTAFGSLGFILGILFVVRNPGIQTPFNVGVHAGVLPLILVGLVLTVLEPAAAPRGTPPRSGSPEGV